MRSYLTIISHKGMSYKYEDGKLYLNGSEYTGKQKGFLKQTVTLLNAIRKSQEGKNLLIEMQSPSNTFTISNLFGFEIKYNDITDPTKKLYNGNSSQTLWNSKSVNPNLPNNLVSNQYIYSYDALNRITGAVNNTTNYNVSGITYDQNGNIMRLLRKGHTNESATTFGNMDNLTYGYDSGNKLLSVTDAVTTPTLMKGEFKDGNKTGNDYDYDDNGNLIQDLNKGIAANGITYNHLNLPSSITTTSGNISYIYDASGTKLQKTVTEGSSVTSITDYSGNYIYENGDLQFFSHPEGYVNAEGSGYEYVYQYKDHLGNIRLSYTNDSSNPGAPTIIEENNYYPFGLQHKGYNNVVNGTENNYQTFQGQEEEKELGKNTYAFQWRDYDPAIARFNKIDRFSEKYYEDTPYHFSKNNPIYFREIAGDSVRVAQVSIYDNANNTNYQQQLVNDWQQQTGLTLNVDANTGLISYATDANGNAIVSTTTDANGNTTQNGSASARADLIGYIDGNGVTDIGVTANDSGAPNGGNQTWLGDSQITSFINGTPPELNDRTLGVGMTALHEFRHTAVGGSDSDPTAPGDTSTGPVVDRVNVYRQELDNNPSNAGARPYGQRSRYQATPSGNNSTIRFRYPTTNRRGRPVRRSTNIRF